MFNRSSEKMHRIEGGKNDWDGIPDGELSYLQRVAKKTKGILTVGNTITLMGTVAVMNGLYNFANGQKALGIVEIAAGRTADLADGYAADMTGTKGSVGRDLDAGVDGIQLVTALVVLEASGALPLIPALAVGTSKALDTVGTIGAKIRGKEMSPEEGGKLGTAVLWGGLSSFMIHAAFYKHLPDIANTALEVTGWGGTIGGVAYKTPATIEYLAIGLGDREQEPVTIPDST